MSFFRDLEARISGAMQADRYRLRNLLRAVRNDEEQGRPPDEKLEKLLTLLDESNRRREKRQALVPRLEYDESLPVAARRDQESTVRRKGQGVDVISAGQSACVPVLPKRHPAARIGRPA